MVREIKCSRTQDAERVEESVRVCVWVQMRYVSKCAPRHNGRSHTVQKSCFGTNTTNLRTRENLEPERTIGEAAEEMWESFANVDIQVGV